MKSRFNEQLCLIQCLLYMLMIVHNSLCLILSRNQPYDKKIMDRNVMSLNSRALRELMNTQVVSKHLLLILKMKF